MKHLTRSHVWLPKADDISIREPGKDKATLFDFLGLRVVSPVLREARLLKVWVWCLIKADMDTRFYRLLAQAEQEEGRRSPRSFLYNEEDAARELTMNKATVRKLLRTLRDLGYLRIAGEEGEEIVVLLLPAGKALKDESTDEAESAPTFIEKTERAASHSLGNQIASLLTRYPDPDLIDQAFEAISSTRKTGRVAESVLLAQLIKWKEFPMEQVQEGIRIYLNKQLAHVGKDEKYLLGIIRNVRIEKTPTSTGSVLLDAYYAGYRD